MGLAEEILAADQSQSLKVNVPEWKCDVWIRSLPLGDLQAWELDALRSDGKGIDEYRTRYLSKCLVDADGKPLFTGDQLKKINGKIGARLYKLAQDHNDIDEKEIQQVGKN